MAWAELVWKPSKVGQALQSGFGTVVLPSPFCGERAGHGDCSCRLRTDEQTKMAALPIQAECMEYPAHPASWALLLHTCSPRLKDVYGAKRKIATQFGLLVTGATPPRLTAVEQQVRPGKIWWCKLIWELPVNPVSQGQCQALPSVLYSQQGKGPSGLLSPLSGLTLCVFPGPAKVPGTKWEFNSCLPGQSRRKHWGKASNWPSCWTDRERGGTAGWDLKSPPNPSVVAGRRGGFMWTQSV